MVSTDQTTNIFRNTSQYITDSSSASALSSGSKPAVAKILTKTVKGSTIEEINKNTSVLPTKTSNLHHISVNQSTIHFQTTGSTTIFPPTIKTTPSNTQIATTGKSTTLKHTDSLTSIPISTEATTPGIPTYFWTTDEKTDQTTEIQNLPLQTRVV